jgi:chromosomal replication initiation ATPase DnaA
MTTQQVTLPLGSKATVRAWRGEKASLALYAAAKRHDMSVDELLRKRGTRDHWRARAELIKELYDEVGLSFPQIATMLRRDHTSVISAYYGGKGKR